MNFGRSTLSTCYSLIRKYLDGVIVIGVNFYFKIFAFFVRQSLQPGRKVGN